MRMGGEKRKLRAAWFSAPACGIVQYGTPVEYAALRRGRRAPHNFASLGWQKSVAIRSSLMRLPQVAAEVEILL